MEMKDDNGMGAREHRPCEPDPISQLGERGKVMRKIRAALFGAALALGICCQASRAGGPPPSWLQQQAARRPCVVQGAQAFGMGMYTGGPLNVYGSLQSASQAYLNCHGYYVPPNPWLVPFPVWQSATAARYVR